jgi:hypothetical protein
MQIAGREGNGRGIPLGRMLVAGEELARAGGAARRESDERTAAHTVSVGGMGPAHSFSLFFFFFICFLLFPLSFHAPNYSLLLHNKYVPLKIRVKP